MKSYIPRVLVTIGSLLMLWMMGCNNDCATACCSA